MNSPVARLVARALIAGLTSFLVLTKGQDWDWSIVGGAIVASVLAALEVLTPLNPNVGVGKPQA